MKINTIKRPPKLSKAERKHWDEVVQELTARGIDPASRFALISDYVNLGSRIKRLTEREGDPELGCIQVSRAANIAIAERRRLHSVLFAGARDPETVPTPAEVEAVSRQAEADSAWNDFFRSLTGQMSMDPDTRSREIAEKASREAELERLYGEPSWAVLAVPAGCDETDPELAAGIRDLLRRP